MTNLPIVNTQLKSVAATNINIQQGKWLALNVCDLAIKKLLMQYENLKCQ